MNKFDEMYRKFDEILTIPGPEFLWSDPDNNENKYYGYRSCKKRKFGNGELRKVCYGIWFIPKDKELRCGDIKKVKEDAVLDIKRHLIWGDNVDKDDIEFPKISMTEKQFKEIRNLTNYVQI